MNVPERSDFYNLHDRKYFRILTNNTNDKFRIERFEESWFSRLFNLNKFHWNLILNDDDIPLDFKTLELAEGFIQRIIKIEIDKKSLSWRIVDDKN